MARGVKIFLIVLGCFFGTIIVLGLIVAIAGTAGMSELRAYQFPAIDMKKGADGAYDGACGIGRFSMKVKVTVKDHRAVAVELTDKQMSNIGPDLAAKLDERVVGRDKPDFDAITGASLTSKAYLIAVADALGKGMK